MCHSKQPTNNNCYFTTKVPLLKKGQKIIFKNSLSATLQAINKLRDLNPANNN